MPLHPFLKTREYKKMPRFEFGQKPTEKAADTRHDKVGQMSVLTVRDFVTPQAETT